MFRFIAGSIFLSSVLLVCGTSSLRGQTTSQHSKAGSAPVELSGKPTYQSYCASCHGVDAKGHGPTAQALKVTPPDLTLLAKRHDGKFPTEYFTTVVLHGVNVPAHGSSAMPIWGPVFVGVNDQRTIVLRVNKLSDYVESLQAK